MRSAHLVDASNSYTESRALNTITIHTHTRYIAYARRDRSCTLATLELDSRSCAYMDGPYHVYTSLFYMHASYYLYSCFFRALSVPGGKPCIIAWLCS